MEERLVVAGLELVGADEEAVWVLDDPVGDVVAREPVERRLGHLNAAVVVLAREGDDGAIGTLALDEVVPDRVVVLDRPLDPARHHHRPRLAADLVEGEDLVGEVIDHDLGLKPDGVVVALDVSPELLLRPP